MIQKSQTQAQTQDAQFQSQTTGAIYKEERLVWVDRLWGIWEIFIRAPVCRIRNRDYQNPEIVFVLMPDHTTQES